MNGAQLFVKCLLEEGVDTIFGYPGGQVIPIYDALYDAPLRHILARHEQGAAHAAEGYARATGKTGVVLATSGPGATNLVTGIANAYMDSIPMVAFTGQVGSSFIGRDAFQEADITGITLPITKHSYLVQDLKDLPRIIKEAFYIANTNRPGPVLVDIPKDLQAEITEVTEKTGPVNIRGYRVLKNVHLNQIAQAAQAIDEAERPVIYAGGGVIASEAAEELRALAEKCKIPVTTTLMGIGGFPANNYLALGMLGMHGTRAANYAMSEADLIVAVGARFSDRVTGKLATFAPNARVIHIDIDAAEIGKNVKAHIPIVGDVKKALSELIARVTAVEDYGEWHQTIDRWKEDYPLEYSRCERDGCIRPQYIIEQISYLTKGNAIVTTEVGQHQMWTAQFYKFLHPRTFITSGGLGTMGFGLPAAIGAKIGRPDKLVIDVSGDGSFQMNIQELATAVEQQLPIVICILNNAYLGMVRQWQQLFYNGRYSYTEMKGQPDFVKVAEAYGAIGMRINKESQVNEALQAAFAVTDRPVVIDFLVEPEANVFPMVAPGDSSTNMMGGDDI